jgi:hypothetical protein
MPRFVFRKSFAFLWRVTTPNRWIMGAFISVAAMVSGIPVPFGLPFALVLVAVGSRIAFDVVCFPVYVRPDGIRGYNVRGIYHTLRWEEITRARGVAHLFMVVSNSSGWPEVWIPLYLSDMPSFVRTVRTYTGDHHLLVNVLERFDVRHRSAVDRGRHRFRKGRTAATR